MLVFRLLGSLEVEREGQPVEVSGQKQRAVLAILLLRAGEVVSTERLIAEVWGESPPPTAATALQNAISQLRKALGAEAVVTRTPGYVLAVDKEQIDVHRFERQIERSRGAEPQVRSQLVREALQLWRGPPLADFIYDAFAQGEIARLEERRLQAFEERIDAEVELGRGAELVSEIEALVRENPLRERLRGQLMLVLYRSDGRPRRSRPTRRRGECSSTNSASSLACPSNNSMRRSSARNLRCSPGP